MKVLFYPHTSKANKIGHAPLKIRITCGPGDVAEISTGKQVDPALWDVNKKKVTGKSVQADILNKFIVNAENKLLKIESDLEREEQPITAEIVRNIYNGVHIQRYGLLQVLEMHNDLFRQRLGQKDFSTTTLSKYVCLGRKLAYFISTNYKRKDMFMSELKQDFIESFFHFLTTKGKDVRGAYVGPLDIATACATIVRFKKIAKIGFKKQAIAINPFEDFNPTFHKEPKEPITMEQMMVIMTKDFKTPRLERVRDRAIVGAFTGMAHSDISTVTHDMITIDMDGQWWINKGRVKTGELSMIPIWEPVRAIIEKYKDDPELVRKNLLFPVISNQKMNQYLEEITEMCDMNVKITSHDFRHYFGDIYLNSGGSIENLARIMGHSTTTTTRRYARRNRATITLEANQVMETIFKHIQVIEERKIS